jgi:AcrR family transcriptional regulator
VAEELFGEQGLDRVSIRDITVAAGANLAAVNYHFGGKEELIEAIFLRRVGPVNDARLAALSDLEAKARGKALKVEEILSAFIQPAVACSGDAKGTKAFGKLFGRCLAETRPEVETLLRQQFQPVVERLESALLRALPALRREDIFWRLKFTFGALHHWLLTKDKAVPEWAAGAGMEEQTRKLIAFAAAGFKAKSF